MRQVIVLLAMLLSSLALPLSQPSKLVERQLDSLTDATTVATDATTLVTDAVTAVTDLGSLASLTGGGED